MRWNSSSSDPRPGWPRLFALLAVVLPLAMAFAGPARAGTTALLIGVSDYDETAGLADLRGPANDVRLLREVLAARGVEDIRTLADGVENGGRPTREAILAGFADLAAGARAGDLVIVHMSGHGSRQRDTNGDEADGYDEVFLPADVSRAEAGAQTIPNAIVDEEIGEAVQAIRKTGADVWLIMDFCHSGTGLRAGGLGTADRFVDPAALGIEVGPVADAQGDDALIPPSPADDDGAQGAVIAFYSAQANELAREVNFGLGDATDAAGERPWYGLFTAKLANRLQTSGAITYRQLFQGVMSDMNDLSVPGGARMQTPFWEGSLIDGVVLGGSATVGLRQYPVDGDLLSAGRVHGLTEGTVVELVADPAAPEDQVLAYAQIEQVKALSAFLRPIADDCVPDPVQLCPADGSLPAEARFARIAVVPVARTVRLSPVLRHDGQDAPVPLASDAPLAAALDAAIARVNQGGGVQFEISADDYDVQVSSDADRLWFGHATAVEGRATGLSWSPDDGDLAAQLARIGYAENFAAVLASIAESGSLLNPSPVAVKAALQRSDPGLLDAPGGALDPVRECRNVARREGYAPGDDLPARADLKQCDLLRLSAQGARSGARDVNRIHIDSQFCVNVAYARVEDSRAPVPLGGELVMCSDCPGGYSAGNERMFVVVSEVRPQLDQLNLEGVVENCTLGGGTRGGPGKALESFLKAVGKPPGTRGAMGGFAQEDVWVESFAWRVLPREVALRRAGR